MVRNVIHRMLQMCPAAWEYLIRSLQLSCLLLLGSLVLLLSDKGGSELFLHAAAFQEYAQVSLLLASIIPVCLEDLSGSSAGTPPGSSKR